MLNRRLVTISVLKPNVSWNWLSHWTKEREKATKSLMSTAYRGMYYGIGERGNDWAQLRCCTSVVQSNLFYRSPRRELRGSKGVLETSKVLLHMCVPRNLGCPQPCGGYLMDIRSDVAIRVNILRIFIELVQCCSCGSHFWNTNIVTGKLNIYSTEKSGKAWKAKLTACDWYLSRYGNWVTPEPLSRMVLECTASWRTDRQRCCPPFSTEVGWVTQCK